MPRHTGSGGARQGQGLLAGMFEQTPGFQRSKKLEDRGSMGTCGIGQAGAAVDQWCSAAGLPVAQGKGGSVSGSCVPGQSGAKVWFPQDLALTTHRCPAPSANQPISPCQASHRRPGTFGP